MYYVASPIHLLKPRDVSNHCPDWFCGPGGRHDNLACAARARADRKYLFRSRAATARRDSARKSAAATATGRRRGSAGAAARAPVADAEPSAAGAGRTPAPGAFKSQPLAPPPGTTVVPQNTQPGIAVAPPQPGAAPGVANAPQARPIRCRDCRRDSASPRAACRRRPASLQPGDEVVSEPPATKITNKKASFSGLDKITGRIINFDEDIGETVQFGALRVKTDACYTRPSRKPPTPTLLSRSTRYAAGRGEADFFGLDVCREPRPAWRRTSDLRHLADRRKSPDHHRQRAPDQPKPPPPPPCQSAPRRSRPRRVRRRRRIQQPRAATAAATPQPGGLFGGFSGSVPQLASCAPR